MRVRSATAIVKVRNTRNPPTNMAMAAMSMSPPLMATRNCRKSAATLSASWRRDAVGDRLAVRRDPLVGVQAVGEDDVDAGEDVALAEHLPGRRERGVGDAALERRARRPSGRGCR